MYDICNHLIPSLFETQKKQVEKAHHCESHSAIVHQNNGQAAVIGREHHELHE